MKSLKVIGTAVLAFAVVGVAPVAQAEEPAPTVVSITFDDGYSATSVGLSAMKARGMKGTLFVNSQRVGYSTKFFNRTQLKAYQDAGFEIGSHTLDHQDLTAMTSEEAKANLCADRANLMDMGFNVTSHAYPFGAENAAIQQAAKDCGFNSARGTSGLKTPTTCSGCDLAETIPPVNQYAIQVPGSWMYVHTVEQWKQRVIEVENNGGGWLPLLFHHICEGCTSNAITEANFVAFLDWLQTRPATTQIKTIHEVIGGEVQPNPRGTTDPLPEPDLVTSGTRSRVIDGVNAARLKDQLILYNRVRGLSTGTNQYGWEVEVIDGIVTRAAGAGNMTIPANGNILSGHGTAATWLKSFAKVGAAVTINNLGDPPPPPPPSIEYPKNAVIIGTATLAVTGVNTTRTSNALIVYTPDATDATGTNQYGTEVVVVGGVVTVVQDKVGNITVPENGYVLSGHGTARTWLLTNAKVGATVVAS